MFTKPASWDEKKNQQLPKKKSSKIKDLQEM